MAQGCDKMDLDSHTSRIRLRRQIMCSSGGWKKRCPVMGYNSPVTLCTESGFKVGSLVGMVGGHGSAARRLEGAWLFWWRQQLFNWGVKRWPEGQKFNDQRLSLAATDMGVLQPDATIFGSLRIFLFSIVPESLIICGLPSS